MIKKKIAQADHKIPELIMTVIQNSGLDHFVGTNTAPLVVEAESAYRDLDAASADGIAYVRDRLCFPLAQGSFEDGMGTAKGQTSVKRGFRSGDDRNLKARFCAQV